MSKLTNDTNKLRFVLWEEPISSNKGAITSISWLSLIERLASNKNAVEPIRIEFLENGKSNVYKKLKRELPSFMPQVLKASGRRLNQIEELTGMLYFDIDFYPSQGADQTPDYYIQQAKQAKEQLMQDPHVYFCWLSISNSGLGLMIKVPDLTFQNFNDRWRQFQNHLKTKYGLPIDEKVHNINRLCFISWDSDIFINDDAVPFPFVDDKDTKTVKNGNSITVLPDKPPFFTPGLPNAVTPASLRPIKVETGSNTKIDSITIKPFYRESKLDIHFPALLKSLKIDGVTVKYDGKCHYWFATKQPAVRLQTGRRSKIKMGARYKNILKQLVTLVWLHPHWNRQEIFDWILYYNRTWCEIPLSYNEMSNMMCHVFDDLRTKNKLSPCTVYKHNHYTSHSVLTKKQKLSKSGKAKANKSVIKLAHGLRYCINILKEANNSNLAKFSNVSRPTTIANRKHLNIAGVNNYIRTTIDEGKEYEGVIIEILPDFDTLIYRLPDEDELNETSPSNSN